MKRLEEMFQTVAAEGEETWFAGANAENGFAGSFGEIVPEDGLERLYIVKGGPGTGKSTLMRQAAREAERAGHRAVRYLCGSDPDSLDAVVIDGRIGIADGTPPHPLEMKLPCAASEWTDLSRFWDRGVLEARREEIAFRIRAKGRAYEEAYSFLRAAGVLSAEARAVSRRCFRADKAEGAVRRLIGKLRRDGALPDSGGAARRRYSHAVTMKGFWKTPAENADLRYAVEDEMGCGEHFMSLLAEQLTRAGAAPVLGLFPVGGKIMRIRAGRCLFEAGRHGPGAVPLRMSRFLDPDTAERGRLRLTEKLRDSALEAAADLLAKAGEHHFALEDIYGAAMDFDRMASYRAAVTEEILARLG